MKWRFQCLPIERLNKFFVHSDLTLIVSIQTPHWLCRSSMWNFSMMAIGTVSLHPLKCFFRVHRSPVLYLSFFIPLCKGVYLFGFPISLFCFLFLSLLLWLFYFILTLHQLHYVVLESILCHTCFLWRIQANITLF